MLSSMQTEIFQKEVYPVRNCLPQKMKTEFAISGLEDSPKRIGAIVLGFDIRMLPNLFYRTTGFSYSSLYSTQWLRGKQVYKTNLRLQQEGWATNLRLQQVMFKTKSTWYWILSTTLLNSILYHREIKGHFCWEGEIKCQQAIAIFRYSVGQSQFAFTKPFAACV